MHKFIKKHKIIFCLFLAMIIILLVVHFLFKINSPTSFFEPNWNAGEILTYLGTMTLAILSVWQNIQANNINKRLQINNIKLKKMQSDINTLENLKVNINKIILSFDIHILQYAIKDMELISNDSLVSNLEKARIDAYNTSNNLAFSKYAEKCGKECLECNKIECYINFRSNNFKNKILKFRCCYNEYSPKYVKIIDTWLDFIYNKSKIKKGILIDNINKYDDINKIIADVDYLQGIGYQRLKKQAYILIEQCDEEIKTCYENITNEIDKDLNL